jgi:hypothetical protein
MGSDLNLEYATNALAKEGSSKQPIPAGDIGVHQAQYLGVL